MQEVGLIGLGKMGYGMALRLKEQGIRVVGTDISKEVCEKIKQEGIETTDSISEIPEKLSSPKIIWIMVPRANVDECLDVLVPKLSSGDIIIDGGNTLYSESIQRAKELKQKGINFIDVGTSGGVAIRQGKACMMIGGEKEVFDKCEFIFKALTVQDGYKYLGKIGSGHFVKGVHNLVEYGMMQAIAEGLHLINKVSEDEKFGLSLKEVCDLWNHGSVNESRLVGWTAEAFSTYPELKEVSGKVFGETHKEMETLLELARKHDVPIHVSTNAIDVRLKTREDLSYEFQGKVLNAMRNIFGGHSIKKDKE